MQEAVARKVFDELGANGYSPKMHEPEQEGGLFEISLPGAGFDLADFKTMARISEDFGVGLKLADDGRITLS
jgi:hypothetical protein